MKRVLLIAGWLLLSVAVVAQDFASRFMDEHKGDKNLTCISVSPKMMEEMLKADTEKDESMLAIISNLKSMQLLSSSINGADYYKKAVGILNRNSHRFEPFLVFDDEKENGKIMVRRKKGEIIELVMLVNEGPQFLVINFTGNMSDKFIDELAHSMERKHSVEK